MIATDVMLTGVAAIQASDVSGTVFVCAIRKRYVIGSSLIVKYGQTSSVVAFGQKFVFVLIVYEINRILGFSGNIKTDFFQDILCDDITEINSRCTFGFL